MKARWLWPVLVLVLLSGAAGTLTWAARVQRRARVETQMARAQMAIVENKWALAARELRIVLDLEPKSDAAWLMLADALFRVGELDDALKSVSRVPSRSPNGAAARLLEGTLLITAGKVSRAEAVLKECLTLDPTSIEARRRLVFLYGIELRRDELQRVLWEMHERGATQTSDLVLLSGSTFIVWNAREILPTIERYAKSDPQHVPTRIALGYYRRKQNDLDGARRDLIEACRLAPGDLEAQVALADCLIDQDDVDEASRLLERMPSAWCTDARVKYFRGRLAERAGRTAEAVDLYGAAVAADIDYREAHYRLGQLLIELGRGEEANTPLERAQKLAEREILLGTLMDTRDPARYAPEVARMERILGHERLAEAWFAEAIRLNPHDDALRAEAAELRARRFGG